MTLGSPPRTVHVEHCMGTVFSIDIRDRGEWRDALAEVVSWLHHVDAVFSTYRPLSVISRLRSGDLQSTDLDTEVTGIMALCQELKASTAGYFDAYYDGGFDPTGVVKGWAIERAGEILTSHGARNHAVNGGGDMQLTGSTAPGQAWRVGISNPLDPSSILTVVSGSDLAVATSGTSERGAHIANPVSGLPPTGLASVTVSGPSLTYADAYATAAFARGAEALDWLTGLAGHEGMTVDAAGRIATTAGFPVASAGLRA